MRVRPLFEQEKPSLVDQGVCVSRTRCMTATYTQHACHDLRVSHILSFLSHRLDPSGNPSRIQVEVEGNTVAMIQKVTTPVTGLDLSSAALPSPSLTHALTHTLLCGLFVIHHFSSMSRTK